MLRESFKWRILFGVSSENQKSLESCCSLYNDGIWLSKDMLLYLVLGLNKAEPEMKKEDGHESERVRTHWNSQ